MPYYDKPLERRYWSMGKVCQKIPVPAASIRYWCDMFNIVVKRNHGGQRIFTLENLQLLKEIYFLLKVEGYTINGAKKKFESQQ